MKIIAPGKHLWVKDTFPTLSYSGLTLNYHEGRKDADRFHYGTTMTTCNMRAARMKSTILQ